MARRPRPTTTMIPLLLIDELQRSAGQLEVWAYDRLTGPARGKSAHLTRTKHRSELLALSAALLNTVAQIILKFPTK